MEVSSNIIVIQISDICSAEVRLLLLASWSCVPL